MSKFRLSYRREEMKAKTGWHPFLLFCGRVNELRGRWGRSMEAQNGVS